MSWPVMYRLPGSTPSSFPSNQIWRIHNARSEMKAGRFQGLRTLFGRRDFAKLCIAQVFGGMGEFLATLALIGFVYDRTHSAFLSGVVLASRILPAALIGSVLSAFVD